MCMRSKLLLALCASVVALLVGAATAAATVERLLIFPGGEVTAASEGVVTFSAGEVTVRCRVTLSGELSREIVPRSGERVGSVARATSSGCEGGERPSVTFLAAPWSLTYSSFSGSQPERMTALLSTLNGVAVSIHSGALTCLYRGEVGLSLALTLTNPYAIGALTTLTNSLSLVSGAGCARSGSLRGTFAFTVRQGLGELQPLPMQANPRSLGSSAATTGAAITFENIETNNVITPAAAIPGTTMGWGASIGNCTFAMFIPPGGRCTARLTADANATFATLVLYREEMLLSVAGRLFMYPG